VCGLATAAATAAVIGGVFGFYYMIKLYRIPARPYWNHWQTAASFVATALTLGATLIAVIGTVMNSESATLITQMAGVAVLGVLLEALGLIFHARDLRNNGGEGAASLFEQSTKFGKSYWLRNVLLGVNVLLALALAFAPLAAPEQMALGGLFIAALLATTILGRALFYVLVIPTTMPGAFFWKNRGFQEHARETGLAKMPQVGVVPDLH
jgi:DMSO reductase anchor subunit